MTLKPQKCSVIEHRKFSCWIYLHYISCSTQPEATSALNRACRVCEPRPILYVLEAKQGCLLLFILGELNFTNNDQDEGLFSGAMGALSCQCGWDQKTLV